VDAEAPSYKGFRFPAEIISHCVWLYHRFPLSFREVEEMMLWRGVIVSHETIRQWCTKFGQTYANGLRRHWARRGAERIGPGSGDSARLRRSQPCWVTHTPGRPSCFTSDSTPLTRRNWLWRRIPFQNPLYPGFSLRELGEEGRESGMFSAEALTLDLHSRWCWDEFRRCLPREAPSPA
jgi:hypothetical protein